MPIRLNSVMREFSDVDAMSGALAERVQSALVRGLATRDTAALAVSGGSTPRRYFPRIAACELDWSRVGITLVDDRWVDPGNPASNERLVREYLLQNHAVRAKFIPLHNAAPTPYAGSAASNAALATLAHPYDLVVMGMGDDGHIASLFPGSPELGAGLDLGTTVRCIGVMPPAYASPALPRISMTLRELLDARTVVLVLQGASKHAALTQALAHGDPLRAPVCALAAHADSRLEIFWAP